MKNLKHRWIWMLTLIIGVCFLSGCCQNCPVCPDCNENDPNQPGTKDYFEVKNGVYKGGDFPEPTSNNAISNVTMNGNVVPGGTSYMTLTSEVKVKTVLVGVEGQKGYYEYMPGQSSYTVEGVVIIISQKLNVEEFTLQIAVKGQDGSISRIYVKVISLIAVGTGQLQVSLSFDNEKDVDLHLIEPNGEKIYYGHRRSENGGELDLDSNPACSIDGVNNENIYYKEGAFVEPGEYKVYAVMYKNCDASIATNYVVSVYYNGALIHTQDGSNPVSGTFPINAPSTGSSLNGIEPVCRFVIPNHGQKQTHKFVPLPSNTTKEILK